MQIMYSISDKMRINNIEYLIWHKKNTGKIALKNMTDTVDNEIKNPHLNQK